MILLDSHYVGWRCDHAAYNRMSSDDSATGVIYGFLKALPPLAERFEDDGFVFAFDSSSSFRRDIYPEYKANRQEDLPEEIERKQAIREQFSELRDVILPAIGFRNIFIQDGMESDDLIAWLVQTIPADWIVVASDKDLYQLLDDCVMYRPDVKQAFDADAFREKYDIEPKQWADVKALAGCPGDNVQGCYGIGPSYAIKYLKGDLKKGKKFETLSSYEGSKQHDLADKLVRLPFAGVKPMKLKSDRFDFEAFEDICHEYGMKSLTDDPGWEKIMGRKKGLGLI